LQTGSFTVSILNPRCTKMVDETAEHAVIMGGKVIIIYSGGLKLRSHLADMGLRLSKISKYIWNK